MKKHQIENRSLGIAQIEANVMVHRGNVICEDGVKRAYFEVDYPTIKVPIGTFVVATGRMYSNVAERMYENRVSSYDRNVSVPKYRYVNKHTRFGKKIDICYIEVINIQSGERVWVHSVTIIAV